MIRTTSSPMSRPASFTAWRWRSVKYAGTVTTARPTRKPRWSEATSRIFPRIFELISWTWKVRPWQSTATSFSFPARTRYWTERCTVSTTSSFGARPMSRFVA
jgi:hypothetical protein